MLSLCWSPWGVSEPCSEFLERFGSDLDPTCDQHGTADERKMQDFQKPLKTQQFSRLSDSLAGIIRGMLVVLLGILMRLRGLLGGLGSFLGGLGARFVASWSAWER